MSAVNQGVGFQFPKGPKEKLAPAAAKMRLEKNLSELKEAHDRLKKILKELEDFNEGRS